MDQEKRKLNFNNVNKKRKERVALNPNQHTFLISDLTTRFYSYKFLLAQSSGLLTQLI